VNESDKIKFERWAFIQEITPEDIAESIEGSEALCHAVRSNHWTDVAEIIKTRIEALAQRIAELRVFVEIKTPSIDDVQELEEYQLRQIERQQQALERQKKAITNKLCLDDDELNLHETNIQLINALKRYVKTDIIIGSVDNAIYKDAKALLESLGEM
jgi:TolA-binding protein